MFRSISWFFLIYVLLIGVLRLLVKNKNIVEEDEIISLVKSTTIFLSRQEIFETEMDEIIQNSGYLTSAEEVKIKTLAVPKHFSQIFGQFWN